MVHLIECFRKVQSTNIYSAARVHKMIDNVTARIYRMGTPDTL